LWMERAYRTSVRARRGWNPSLRIALTARSGAGSRASPPATHETRDKAETPLEFFLKKDRDAHGQAFGHDRGHLGVRFASDFL
jgi:hypothetical protein